MSSDRPRRQTTYQTGESETTTGRARRLLMTDPSLMEASLEGPIPGCNRLQICGLLARFCRDLQNYPVDIVDVSMSPVQFETRHSPHSNSQRSYQMTEMFNSALA
jgi:hypothetical protein